MLKHLFKNQLRQIYHQETGHCWLACLPEYEELSDTKTSNKSPLMFYEDGKPLGPAHALHDTIRETGKGAYAHWNRFLYFSTSDNSNPNKNGRTYSISVKNSGFRKKWVHEKIKTLLSNKDAFGFNEKKYQKKYKKVTTHSDEIVNEDQELKVLSAEHLAIWKRHPDSEFLIERGGKDIPPPIACNVPITSICNLKCTICGAQNSPDHIRRHMDIDIFRQVAKTLFPLMTQVEINSLGEPLAHPHIEEILGIIKDYQCYFKLQSNATLLTPGKIKMLSTMCGELFLSIDATGELFNKVRLGGKWKNVDKYVRQLMAEINKDKLKVWLTPTISDRTLPDVFNILDWAKEIGIYVVLFRRYKPILYGNELPPSHENWERQINNIKKWIQYNGDFPFIMIEDAVLSGKPKLPNGFPDRKRSEHPNYPKKDANNPLDYICYIPFQYIETGMDGEIYLCCQNQSGPTLGYATSIEAFAEAWFGEMYNKIRESLRSDFKGERVVKNCDNCIKSVGSGDSTNFLSI